MAILSLAAGNEDDQMNNIKEVTQYFYVRFESAGKNVGKESIDEESKVIEITLFIIAKKRKTTNPAVFGSHIMSI